MVREEVVALEGFEEEFEYLNGKIDNIKADEQAEIDKVVAEVEAKFAVKLDKYKSLVAEISEVREVEVPEVEEEVENAEEVETVEE